MTDPVIQSGIPIPLSGSGCQKRILEKMAVGDSFFEPDPKRNWRMAAALSGMKVSQRREGTGIRVWRTA